MANEIGNGNNLNASFLQTNYTTGGFGNYAGDMLDLIRQAENDPVWSKATIDKITVESLTDPKQTAENDALGAISSLFSQVNELAFSTPSDPSPSDSSHPEGSLQVGSDGTITTPGGYKIEQTGQFSWKVTGTDGKSTEIWGDPHAKESDGGNWDFKRDSTFVLADGTRINVKTTPWQDGKMTVTQGLEIISGNDRVQVTDIDKGKGKVGQITKDGYANVNSFGNKDVFVMGKETDDWSFKGKEIIGSEQNGEKFKLGNDLEAGVVGPIVDQNKKNGGPEFFAKMFEQISKMFDALAQGIMTGKMPDLSKIQFPGTTPESGGCFPPPTQTQTQGTQGTEQNQQTKPQDNRIELLKKSFAAVSAMLEALSKLLDLARSIPSRRTYQSV